MNRPLLLPALAFAAGILLQEHLGGPLPWWLVGAALSLLSAFKWPRPRPYWILAGWGLAGGLAHAIQQTPLSPADLRRIAGSTARLVELRGRIAETPTLRLKEKRGQWLGRTMVRLDVTAWRPSDGSWEPASGAVMTATRGVFPDGLFRGRRVEVTGVLQAPTGPAAPGLFDYREFLRHAGIWHTLEVAAVTDWNPSAGASVRVPWSERFLPWAQHALARGLPDDEATRLLWAMTLGWRTALAGDVDTTFMEAGTMHVFAISGLHIMLISGMLVAVLRAFRLSRRGCGIVAVPAVWFYVAATGWQPSAVRSAVMMTVVVGGWTLNRPGDLLNSLALAALVILVREPGQLLLAGFQLSFGVVGGLALLAPLLEPWFQRWLRFHPDPFLPKELLPVWQRWLTIPLRPLAVTMATGVAAFLSSLPLTVQYFHLFSPVTLLANLLVVPLSSLALAANLASLAVTPVWPGLAEVFNASAWLWMHAMTGLSRWFASWPGGVWYVAAPASPWWLGYYAILTGVATGWAVTPSRRRRGLVAVVIFGVAALVQYWRHDRRTTLTIFPATEAVIIDAPGRRRDLVLNTGGISSGPAVITPFLHSQGWNRVPTLAVAQADAVRVGGGVEFLKLFRPSALVITQERQRSPAFRQLLEAAAAERVPIRLVRSGDELAGWTVLSPAATDSFKTADDNSLVLAGNWAGVRVLWLSHLGRAAQRALLDREAATGSLVADLVVAGPPRTGEPLNDELLAAIRPQWIILTAHPSPTARRARAELRARLSRSGARVVDTEECGTVTLRFQNGRADLEAMNGTRIELTARQHSYPREQHR